MVKKEDIKRLVGITPSKRQLMWHELEFYAFIHFGINTFYDREWGTGKEDCSRFNPTELSTEQWVRSIKAAGMKAVLLTCKHHDGFCLWPSEYTEFSVKNSPYKNGTGDIVKELSEACRKYDLKFGIYLSPWDQNHLQYGQGKAYDDYFINQLTELLTQYGDIFSVWFDGACGEGPNGKKQIYDWKRYYEHIRALQPDAVINISGPDVRWCGNEAGICRKSEWNVVSARVSDTTYVASNSQQEDDEAFRLREISNMDEDLGSREALEHEQDLIWYPSEVDTSIRPGWFYHATEDDKVKSLEQLLEIYYNSVGGNASLLLNIPVDQRGLVHETEVTRLREIGEYLEDIFKDNIAPQANVSTLQEDSQQYSVCNVVQEGSGYYKPNTPKEQVEIKFKFDMPKSIRHIVLQEELSESQRIETFEIWGGKANQLSKIYENTVVGSKRICKLEEIEVDEIEVRVTASRIYPTFKFIGIYT